MKKTALILGTMALLGATAAEAQVCEQDQLQENLHYLRQLSLDLRGRLPDLPELESVVTNGAVDPALITNMVQSEESIGNLREFFQALLWTNIADVRVADAGFTISRNQTTSLYYNANRSVRYRGGTTRYSCLDEPARFGAAGEILTTPEPGDPGVNREGYVMVAPYWNPSTSIKVCAFDAQDALTVTVASRTYECNTNANQRGCGCGPNLRWCHSGTDRTEATVTAAMAEQGHRFIDKIVREGRPYTELLTSKDFEINGPLSHYLRYQTTSGMNRLFGLADNGYTVPNIPWDQPNTWQAVRGGPLHSGILTMPIYLLKFQSDRGRANRFYNAFLCSYFKVPEGTTLPSADDPCTAEPDLSKRCGCKYCHIAVEPAAAHWGRMAEAGFSPLDPTDYPAFKTECTQANAASNATCKRLYFISPGAPSEMPYKGWLRSYVFATDEMKASIEAGPSAIAATAITNGAFAACATRKMWERYLSREANDETDAETLAALTETFKRSNYDLRVLISEIVKRPEYLHGGNYDGKETAQ